MEFFTLKRSSGTDSQKLFLKRFYRLLMLSTGQLIVII